MLRVFVALLCIASAATAQVNLTTSSETSADVSLPETITREEARNLMSELSDAEVRRLLLERLDAVADEQAAASAGTGSSFAEVAFGSVARSVRDAVSKLPDIGGALARSFERFQDIVGPNGLAFLVITMTIAISCALIVEMLFRRAIRGWVDDIDLSSQTPSMRQTLSFLGKRLTGDVVAVLVFFFSASNIFGPLTGNTLGPMMLASEEQGARVAQFIFPIWGNLIVMPRVAAAIGRFLLAPNKPQFRIVHLDDFGAKRLYWHQIGLALLLGFTFWLPGFMAMTGEGWGETRLGFWLNLALHVYVIVLAWRYRDSMRLMMRGPDADVTQAEAFASRIYPYFIIVATIVTLWVVEILAGYGMFDLLSRFPHIWMLILISFAPAMDTVVRGLVRQLMPPMTGEGALAERAYQATRRSYVRIGRVIVFGIVVLAIARIWQIDFENLASASVGARLAGQAFEMLIVLSFGYLIYEIVSLWINRKLAAEQTEGAAQSEEEIGGGEGGGAGGSRLSTVLPLVLATARVTIVVVFALLALGNVGVDTTPLLAGAGIVGLAVGFGAQKLVTDVVSGIFFLVDDAFRTGEYVEVDGTMGTVEKISIRSMQLRHHKGPVHTIPYGEIPKLTNYSRDWVIMKLRFTVPFDTDPNKVKKIFKKIGQDMMEVPEFAEDFLQPFKSQGVFEIDDVGMVIRGKFMAKPGKQFTLRKEIYNRVKAAFTENGIEFARREVRVAIPGMDAKEELTEEDKASIAAAASQAAQDMAESIPDAAKPGD